MADSLNKPLSNERIGGEISKYKEDKKMLFWFILATAIVAVYWLSGFGLFCFYFGMKQAKKDWTDKNGKLQVPSLFVSVAIFSLMMPLGLLFRQCKKVIAWAKEKRESRNAKRRERKRKLWLENNPTTIFYNYHAGVFAFVRADDYEKEFVRHERHVRQEIAKHDTLLLDLIPLTIVFALSEERGRYKYPYLVSGGKHAIDALMEKEDIVLVQKDDIFVPLCNAFILSYEEQQTLLGTRIPRSVESYTRDNTHHATRFLINNPFPSDLR